jgi:metal-dependent HD superfamily phosphatase/phosphodiesterase
MLTLAKVKSSPQVKDFITKSQEVSEAMGYTDHGFRHSDLVSRRAKEVAKAMGLSRKDQELAAVAGYCHDMGIFLGRDQHHYWAGLLFGQLFLPKALTKESQDITEVMQAIVNHDKIDLKIFTDISALLILADKSDVHRSRVTCRSMRKIKKDIHDRVNYAVTKSELRVDKTKKKIVLNLKTDTRFVPIMQYFEIFTKRMAYCRQSARFLGYRFGLVINRFKLL